MNGPADAIRRKITEMIGLLLLLAILPAAAGVSCLDDSEMIDRHEQKLDEEDE